MVRLGEKTGEARLRRVGHVRRKDDGLYWEEDADLLGKKKRRTPKMRFIDAVSEDMEVVEVKEEDAGDGIKWRWKSRSGDH